MSRDQAALLRALVEKKAESKLVEKPVTKPVSILSVQLLKERGFKVEATEPNSMSEKGSQPNLLAAELELTDKISLLRKVGLVSKDEHSETQEDESLGIKESGKVQPDESENFSSDKKSSLSSELNRSECDPSLVGVDDGVRIMAVCSGKGGVGKTNIVLNMAIALKRSGKKPLIIDTDCGFTNIDILCGMAIPYTIQNVLAGERQLSEVIVDGPEGVKIISGGNDVMHLRDAPESHREVFQEQFSQLRDIDILLIDMGAGVSKTALMYASFAQEILLVTTPEATSLADAYSLLKIMDMANLQKSIKVVINRVSDEVEGFQAFTTLNRTVMEYLRFGVEYVSYIREDKSVSNSAKSQVPLMIRYPDSSSAKDVSRLATMLFESEQPVRKAKNMHEVMGRLMRIFGR